LFSEFRVAPPNWKPPDDGILKGAGFGADAPERAVSHEAHLELLSSFLEKHEPHCHIPGFKQNAESEFTTAGAGATGALSRAPSRAVSHAAHFKLLSSFLAKHDPHCHIPGFKQKAASEELLATGAVGVEVGAAAFFLSA
jgi:hypothetical protein